MTTDNSRNDKATPTCRQLSSSKLRGCFYHRQALLSRLRRVSCAQYGNWKIISGAEIDDTIFADFRENRRDTISDTNRFLDVMKATVLLVYLDRVVIYAR